MLLHLADRLEMPLRERNRLLLAGGFAPMFGERAFDLTIEALYPADRDTAERLAALLAAA